MDKIKTICNYINKQSNKFKPEIGIILGSGLGSVTDALIDDSKASPVSISYSDIPGFPVSTIKGHEGKLILVKINNKNVIIMQGRFHYYEGYSAKEIAIPIKMMKKLGVQKLIVTNAAGAVNTDFKPGDLMVISDHINLSVVNPLRGSNDDSFGERFPDMTDCYNLILRQKIIKAAAKKNIKLKEGVYMFFPGPNYETKAEIRAARALGADAVGMSTIPEVLSAVHCGIKVIGISCISNMAAGINNKPMAHKDVLDITAKVNLKFKSLLKLVINEL
jgi:purine-nucleoside phosphorylase